MLLPLQSNTDTRFVSRQIQATNGMVAAFRIVNLLRLWKGRYQGSGKVLHSHIVSAVLFSLHARTSLEDSDSLMTRPCRSVLE